MHSNRRCGFSSFPIFLAILAFLLGAPSALSQALTMVQSTTRSAGSSAAGYNGDFGTATTVSLNNPSYVVFDSNGNQFLSDTLNNCVRKIDTSGNVTTIAGLGVSGESDTCNSALNPAPTPTQGLYQPAGLAIDSSNRLYIADSKHNCVRALFSGQSGVANLTTVAGTCGSDPTISVTPAPNGLAVDASSTLYISLQDSVSSTKVYQVVQHAAAAAATNVCLVAGAPSANVSTNCPGIPNGVVLSGPSGLALNVSGDLYIADTGNNCVRQVAGVASGSATLVTAVGKCLNDASGNSATAISNPYGIAVSPIQLLFISESSPNNVVSYTPGSGAVQLVAGLPSGAAGPYNSTQDGQAAVSVPLNGPRGVAFDSMAHLFLADSLNNILRESSNNLSFPNTPVGSTSSVQPITFAINQPVNLSTSIGSDYTITSTTCAGALLPAPTGATPNTCEIFVRFAPARPGVRRSALKITDSVSGTSIYQGLQAIGTGALTLFTPGAPATIASSLASPATITTDAAGNAYVLETAAGPGTPDIRLIPVGGGPSSPAVTLTGVATPTAMASDAAGNWYVADTAHGTVSRFGADGSVNTSYITGLDTPTALYVDAFDNLYIAQAGASHNVIEAYISGARRIIAGSGSNPAADGVPAANASFVSPSAITINIDGILYIADQGGHLVYAVDNNGIIHIVAGNGTTSTTTVGKSRGTALALPTSLATDAAGDLYIAEQTTGNIYVVYVSSTSGTDTSVIFNTSAPPAPNGPLGIALDGDSNLFISRNATNSVLEISYPNPTVGFGTVMVGNTSAVMLQNLTNAGTDNINVTSAYSTTDSHFSVNTSATTCGSTILTGYTCTIGFTFTPTANAPYSAQSIISSNSYNTPQPITLTGIGKELVTPTFNLPAQSEIYGQPFPEVVTFNDVTAVPTGTITFMTGSQTLCTLTGTFSTTTTCNAPPSGLSVGTYTVTFNYSGDTNYNPASGITTLTVAPAPLTEVVNNASRIVGAPNPPFSGTLTGVVPGDTILVAYSTTATVTSPVGSYPITATLTAVAPATLSNYTVTNTPGTLSITQATATFALPAQTEVYGQPFPAPFTLGGIAAGIPATGTISFTIGKTTLCSMTGTFNSGNTVCNAPNSGLSVGTYVVSFNYSGDTNYASHTGTTTLTVTAAPLTVTVANANRPYGAPNPAFTSTITGAVAGDTFIQTFSTPATISSPIGTYPINDVLSGSAASNYTITITPGTLTITTAALPLTVAVNTASRPYGAANPAFTSTITGALNGDTFTVTYSTTATVTSPIGSYAVIPTVSGPALSNYTLITTPGTLTVLPATLTVTANSTSRAYGAANPTFTGTITGALNGDTFTVTYSTPATVTSPVGGYTITPSVSGAALANYTLVTTPGTLTVTPVPLMVMVANASRPYGTANPAFTSTITGALNGDTFIQTFSTPATTSSSVGTYPINDVLSGPASSNYTITVVPGTLTITTASAVLAVAVNNVSRTYGAANPAFTSTITGALNGDTFTITYSTTATVTSPVGGYTVTPNVSGAALSNYTLMTIPGTLNVTPAPLTVTANNASRAYGVANPTFAGTTVGLLNGDNVTVNYMTAATINSPVGTYPIVPNVSGTALSNYNLSVVNGTLTITANGNSLVINVNSAARVYGTPNPAFSGTVTGVLPGDDVVVSYSTTATQASSAGNYPIGANVSGTSAGNYIATIHPGTLAVTAASTTTTISTSAPSALIGTNVTFTASVTSTVGTVSGVVNFFDGTVMLGSATLTAAGTATFTTNALSVGTHNISAAFQANTNFNTSGASLNQTITQAVGAFTISATPNAPFIKGAGTTLYQVTVNPSGAFAGQVALACSGLPADATCTFATPTVTLTAGTSVTTTMTVTTTVADAKLEGPVGLPSNPADLAPFTVATIFPAELTGLGVLFAGLRRRKTLGTQKMRLLLLIVFTLGILGLVGCGCPSTVFHTYTINVTGTSLSFPAPAQTISVLLSVGQQ